MDTAITERMELLHKEACELYNQSDFRAAGRRYADLRDFLQDQNSSVSTAECQKLIDRCSESIINCNAGAEAMLLRAQADQHQTQDQLALVVELRRKALRRARTIFKPGTLNWYLFAEELSESLIDVGDLDEAENHCREVLELITLKALDERYIKDAQQELDHVNELRCARESDEQENPRGRSTDVSDTVICSIVRSTSMAETPPNNMQTCDINTKQEFNMVVTEVDMQKAELEPVDPLLTSSQKPGHSRSTSDNFQSAVASQIGSKCTEDSRQREEPCFSSPQIKCSPLTMTPEVTLFRRARSADSREGLSNKIENPCPKSTDARSHEDVSRPLSIEEDPGVYSNKKAPEAFLFDLGSKAERYMRDLQERTLALIGEGRRNEEENGAKHTTVKIAIIDTGLDGQHEDIIHDCDRIRRYKCFVNEHVASAIEHRYQPGPPGVESLKTICKDADGHGTMCARCILHVDPYSQLYIARVATGRGSFGSLNTVRAVAEAIRYSVQKWKVDIISMSFGFEDAHNEIKEAIKEAVRANTLLFAAASNDGLNTPSTGPAILFPARLGDVFGINSANSYGRPSSFNPRQDEIYYCAWGEKVSFSLRRSDKSQKSEVWTGTSVATPIAAGFVSLFLEFVRQKPQTEFAVKLEKVLKEVDTIKTLFADMPSRPSDKDARWIIPWQYLNMKASSSEGLATPRKIAENELHRSLRGCITNW